MTSEPKTILLTGATGVVGAAVLRLLRRSYNIVCLTHVKNVAHDVASIRGDISQPELGLNHEQWLALADSIDVVVHCAALTGFSASSDDTARLNVVGTEHVVDLARASNSPLVYMSTAFVRHAPSGDTSIGDGLSDPQKYLDSKRAAEAIVRRSRDATILRPSVVIGDSQSGEIASLQGLLMLAYGMLRNMLPLVPLDPAATIDFVPQDLVADVTKGVIDSCAWGEEIWITAGAEALDAKRVVGVTQEVGVRRGLDVLLPRLVPQETIRRLIRPVFVSQLEPIARRNFDDMVTLCGLVSNDEPFPCNIETVAGCVPASSAELETSFVATVDRLIESKRLLRRTRTAARAAQ